MIAAKLKIMRGTEVLLEGVVIGKAGPGDVFDIEMAINKGSNLRCHAELLTNTDLEHNLKLLEEKQAEIELSGKRLET